MRRAWRELLRKILLYSLLSVRALNISSTSSLFPTAIINYQIMRDMIDGSRVFYSNQWIALPLPLPLTQKYLDFLTGRGRQIWFDEDEAQTLALVFIIGPQISFDQCRLFYFTSYLYHLSLITNNSTQIPPHLNGVTCNNFSNLVY